MGQQGRRAACRIPGVLTILEDPDAHFVTADTLRCALVLTQHYLREYMRLVGSTAVPDYLARAQAAFDRLHKTQRETVTLREVTRLGPKACRTADLARQAVEIQVKNEWLKPDPTGRVFLVHPAIT